MQLILCNTKLAPVLHVAYLGIDAAEADAPLAMNIPGAAEPVAAWVRSSRSAEELPADLRSAFDKEYGFTLEDILNSLYNRPSPNRFLASFSVFLSPNREHPFVHGLLERSFQDFFDAHIKKYEDYHKTPVGFIGSIASVYQDILSAVAAREDVEIFRILSSPAEGLIEYHQL